MRYTTTQGPTHRLDPASMHSLGYTLLAAVLMTLGSVAVVLAVLYPVAAASVAVLAGAGRYAVRTFRRHYRTRRRASRTREVCVEL